MGKGGCEQFVSHPEEMQLYWYLNLVEGAVQVANNSKNNVRSILGRGMPTAREKAFLEEKNQAKSCRLSRSQRG